MKEPFTILIADRNPHVRKFLEREMIGEGYKVRLARSAGEVLELVFNRKYLDLLILDLDLPDAAESDILQKLQGRVPTLPVVVHTFLSECIDHPAFVSSSLVFVEKEGSNVERLKNVVNEVLRKSYPRRWDSKNNRQPQAEYSYS